MSLSKEITGIFAALVLLAPACAIAQEPKDAIEYASSPTFMDADRIIAGEAEIVVDQMPLWGEPILTIYIADGPFRIIDSHSTDPFTNAETYESSTYHCTLIGKMVSNVEGRRVLVKDPDSFMGRQLILRLVRDRGPTEYILGLNTPNDGMIETRGDEIDVVTLGGRRPVYGPDFPSPEEAEAAARTACRIADTRDLTLSDTSTDPDDGLRVEGIEGTFEISRHVRTVVLDERPSRW